MMHSLVLCLAALLHFGHATTYTSDWAIRIRGDMESVNRVAEKYGFTNMGQIGELRTYYMFHHQQTANRSTVYNKDLTTRVTKETEVEWLQQQVVKERAKRSYVTADMKTRGLPAAHTKPVHTQTLHFNDPVWSSLWYFHCIEKSKGCRSHMNIAAAWERGYTGKGVVVSVLDDGIEKEHPDLKPNYDPVASYDMNGRDPDPSPHYSSSADNYHGTRCAGMVAAAANNSQCTVGVSFNARIGGVRMLDGDVTDITEAQSLSFSPHYIDVYLSSWGPGDDGATLEGPGPLALRTLQNAVKNGRNGRGSIYVWASGNGGRNGDHCSCDGYSSSIYTIAISSTTWHGSHPDYLEQCPSIMATAFTGGDTEGLITLGPRHSCMWAQSGSSLSSSMAAGVIALTLEANPLLTWRDVQHIIVQTSKAHYLVAPDWHINGAGYKVSHLYGFGLLDAEGMVKEAERWRHVPSQHECVVEAPIQQSRTIHPGLVLTSVYETRGCSDEPQQHIVYVEHVVVRVTITHSRRGDLSITLTSPSGTVSQLLANRPLDNSTEGFQNWNLMTTHCWGEQGAGKWILKIKDTPSQQRVKTEPGKLKQWSLVIYGTAEKPYPVHRKQVRSTGALESDLTEEYTGPCDPECSEDGCLGPSSQHCLTCSHFFLQYKNGTRLCVSECPKGFWGDRWRCKRCPSSCEVCTGSRGDQCTSCQPGYHLTEGTNVCTAFCEDNYYLDHETDVCRKCSENCLNCVSHSICTECSPGTSLQGNRCQRSCSAGYYHDKQEDECRPCHQACATCAGAGAEDCRQCAEGYVLEKWRCVASCSPNFYAAEPNPEIAAEHRICRRCDTSCLTCVGPGSRNCSSCSSGHSLQEGECVVNTLCAEGEYHDSNGQCQACHTTCAKCTGPQSTDCISCVSSRVMNEGLCVVECGSGKFPSGGRCHLCDHTCATCVDAGRASCTSCDTDKFGMERYLYKGQCLDMCPEAFYHSKDGRCESCPENCRLCTGPNRCHRCNSSYYSSDGACVKLECGEGEVKDPESDDCMACEEGCSKCVLYNPKHCLSCTEGFYNFQESCYRNCPAKTYSVEEEMTCVPCDDNCVSCDQHECYWCETDLFLSEGACVSECPDGYYGDEDTNDCEECHSDCETCNGFEASDCLSCEDKMVLENGMCVPENEVCPFKTFRTDDGECVDCHPSCESCSGDERNQCTTCAKGQFLTTQQTCVSKCPVNFFANQMSGECEVCSPGCLQCVDDQRCTRCQSSRRTPLFLQDGQCVQQCVRGYPAGSVCRNCAAGCASCWRNATHCLSCEEPLFLHKHQCVDECPAVHTVQDGECRRCAAACQECDPFGQCSECEEFHFLHDGVCVVGCPGGFFEDPERGECLPCHPNCAFCDGPNANECDACTDPDSTLHNGACLMPCPPYTYRESVTGECQDCDTSCLSCRGPHTFSCTSCRDGQTLDGHSRCVPSADKCLSHQYADQDGECHQCHNHCHRCSGPGKTHCLSCNQGHFLLNGTCVDECTSGFYEDVLAQKCEPCHPSCDSCVGGNRHECLTCKAHLFREGKECVEICQHSHYGNTGSGMCEKCDPSCGECTGGREDSCLSCTPGLIYMRKESRCLPTCPEGFYHDVAHRTCEPCHASCRTCSGKTSRSCSTCYTGYLLSEGTCESRCDIGQYPVVKGSSHSCEDCHSSCLECRGPGRTNCTMCPAQAILEAGGRCLRCCRHGDSEEAGIRQQHCCNCTESRGECVLSTNLAFTNDEEEEMRGNLTLFIIACILLVLGLVAVVFIVRHSRSKSAPRDMPPRGYEKLGSGGGFGGKSSGSNSRHGGSSIYTGNASSSGGRLQETQMVDFGERRSRSKVEDDDDDEDIVYMGKDGTVYRKFRYGQLEDNEDDLEYDDEGYNFSSGKDIFK